MAIPAEDSAALMEGMMLHRQGLACVARAGAGAGAAAASAAAAAKEGGTRSAQQKKARHPPLPPQGGKTPYVGETTGTTPIPTPTPPFPSTATATTTATTNSGSVGKGAEGSLDEGPGKEALECSGGGRSEREEGGTQGAPEEKGEQEGDMQVEDDAQDLGAPSAGETAVGGGGAAMSDERKMAAGIAGHDASAASKGPEGSKGVAKGKGRPKPGERALDNFDIF